MTKKLEELFNLEESNTAEPVIPVIEKTKEEVRDLERSYKEADAIAGQLPAIADLDSLGEHELDALSKKAEAAYDDLMDLGMNVEVRYSGRIFEVASSMMGNAIAAKSAKIDKKLKAIDAKLKKLKIDRDAGDEDPNNMLNGQAYVITDRNELLKKLQGKE